MKKLSLVEKNIIIYITVFIVLIAILCGIASQSWQFWLIFEIVLCVVLVTYFSKGFRDLLNIHSVATGLIVLYSLPSTIMILQGKIELSDNELLVLFSTISIGLIGYTFGVLFKRSVSFGKRNRLRLSKKINTLFWLAYKYRHVLVVFVCIVLLFEGFMSGGMSYRESVVYRMETTGVIIYFNSLVSTVFSPLIVGMISIVGDLNKYRRLSWLSYLLIVLIILSIIGGHRIWIIALFACLMLAISPRLSRKSLILLVVLSFFLTFLISGAVRYSRSGKSFTEIAMKFHEYSLNVKTKSLSDLMWGWSSFNVPFLTFIPLIKNIPRNINFDYYAYVNDLSLIIPKIIYPERPLPYNKWYVKTFEPEIFERGGGKTFYILGFGYLFAGLIGVFIHLFLFGILFECLNKVFRMIGSAAGLFLYSYFFIGLLKFVVGYGLFVFIKANLVLNFFIPISLLFLFVLILDTLTPKKAAKY